MSAGGDRGGNGERQTVHWPALDGLRGIAVLAVIAYHLGWIAGGFLGVDLFFVVSGFLITSLLLREHRATFTVDVIGFWARRLRRLLPAVAFMIAVTMLWIARFGTPAEQAVARSDARWSLPYLTNWHLIDVARDYWATAGTPSAFTHLWSLAIEEQFYLIWPVLVMAALHGRGHRGDRRLGTMVVIGIVAATSAMFVLSRHSLPGRVYFGTDTRAAALLLGAAMSLPVPQRRLAALARWRPRLLDAVVSTAAVCVVGSWMLLGHQLSLLLSGGLVVHAAVAAVLVGGLAASSGRLSRWCTARVLVWTGVRSYGLYLWHYPLIRLARPRMSAVPAGVRDLAIIAASFGLAACSYRWLERPVRHRHGWAVGRRSSVAMVTLSVLATVVVVVAPSGRGHIAEFDAAALASSLDAPLAARAVAVPAVAPNAVAPELVASLPATAFLTSASSDVVDPTALGLGTIALPARPISRVLWLGDSVAADLAPAVTAALAASAIDVVDGTYDGARIVPSDRLDTRAILADVLAAHPADLVVVPLSYWDASQPADVLRSEIRHLVDAVRWYGADIVFVTPPPVRADLADPGMRIEIAVVADLVRTSPAHLTLVDVAALWGPEMHLDLDLDGVPDRKPDGVHICPQGAARFAAWFVDRLRTRYPAVPVAAPAQWLDGTWSTSERYDTPVGACAGLTPG